MNVRPSRLAGVALAVAIVFIAVACGFHLQGALQLPAAMSVTFLDVSDADGPLARKLRSALEDAGTTLTPRREDATAVLRLVKDEAGQRVLSVSPTGVPEEYELYHTMSFSLTSGGKTLVEPHDVTVTRDYRFDRTDVLGKRQEAEYLEDALVDDAVQLILRRLSLVH